MTKQIKINWDKLRQIEELKQFFEEDDLGFKKLIEYRIEELKKFSDSDLDKFAKIQALQVTNGCTQWGFRRKDPECLSVEQTRECMNLVMGFMKRTELYFPSIGKIEIEDEQKAYMQAGRSIYKQGFKNNDLESKRQYYAISTAEFIVCGREKIESALKLVKQDYEIIFSTYYIERGHKYIARYLEAFERA